MEWNVSHFCVIFFSSTLTLVVNCAFLPFFFEVFEISVRRSTRLTTINVLYNFINFLYERIAYYNKVLNLYTL